MTGALCVAIGCRQTARMLFKALVGLLLATSHNLLAAEGACNFPPDYLPPDISSIINSAIYHIGQDTVYVYTDTFGNCSGCVTELSVCYAAYSTPNPMKVFVVDDENTIVHVHSFTGPTTSTENMDTYCETFQSSSLCCSYLPLAPSEQFVVRSTDHYGVWYSEQLAFHASYEERGHYVTSGLTPLEVGVNISSSIYNIPKIYFHLIISPGPCETNTSATVSFDTTPPTPITSTTPSSSQLTHPQSTGIAGSNPTALRGLTHTPTTLLQAPTTSYPYITSSGKAAVPPSTTVTPLQSRTSQNPLVSNIGKADTNTGGAGVAPLVVGGISGGAVLVLVALLFATLAVALVVRYRTRHLLQNKKSFSTPQRLNGHNLTTLGKVNPRNVVPTNSKPAGDFSDEGNRANISKPIVVDSNPAYGSTSLDKKPAYSTPSLQEQSTQTKPIEFGSNPAYGSSLQANPAYTSSGQTMEMGFNPSPGGQGQKDEIYSYIPNEEEQRTSWTSSVLIPTSLNEAYTSMTTHQEEVEPEGDCTDDEGYVINSLVYEVAPDELKTRVVPHNHSEHEVNQLTRDTENSSHSRMAHSMTINEAYIAVNQATD